MFFKHSKLLTWLLAPFFMMADADSAAAVDRGDTLDTGAPDLSNDEDEVAKLAAEAGKKDETDDKEDKDEEEEEDEEKKPKKDSRIPLSRHKQIIEKERAAREALEAELAKYKNGEQVAKTNEKLEETENKLISMETEYNKLLADGEIDKAAAKMTEIRKLERTIVEQKASSAAAAAEARAYERVKYDTVVERLESAYPVLNPDADEFDEEVVTEVLEMKEFYQSKNLSPAQALQKAVERLLKPQTAKQKDATSVDPRVKAEEVAKARKLAATKAGIDAANKTPAQAGKAGLDSDKLGGSITDIDPMKLSQDEFAKLDEKTLAKMRGDTL